MVLEKLRMAKERNKSLFQNKWIRWGLIPLILFGLWFALTFWYIVIFDKSFTVLSYNHSEENFSDITHQRLLEDEKLSGEFTARENNLGIVAMRFRSFQRIPYDQEDLLVFRLKEKGDNDWYYEGEYMSGLTFDVPFLPFGFPPIADSQGKEYVFELESTRGNQVNGVSLSTREPFLVSMYQADRSVLVSDPQALLNFVIKKFFNSFSTIDIWYSSVIFSFPLFFYLFWISPLKRHIVDRPVKYIHNAINKKAEKSVVFKYILKGVKIVIKYNLLFVLASAVLVDILILQILNDLLYLSVIFIWIFLLKVYKLDSRPSFIAGLFFLIFAPIFLEFNNTGIAEKAAAWAFMFFAGGVFIEMISLRKSGK